MLPDGAEKQLEDWTIFFLNQTPFNTIAPVLALEKPYSYGDKENEDDEQELLYVLNLVRTKHDKAARRYVALALCARVGLSLSKVPFHGSEEQLSKR